MVGRVIRKTHTLNCKQSKLYSRSGWEALRSVKPEMHLKRNISVSAMGWDLISGMSCKSSHGAMAGNEDGFPRLQLVLFLLYNRVTDLRHA